ncbi:MAG TPA: serine/threonine-protein kinase [Gemmataceae bacterium]|jgi:serine/threonine-protein kinase
MTNARQFDLPQTLSLDPAAAAALDSALDDLQSGRPVDREALLARYPQLNGALEALGQLIAGSHTLAGCSSRVSGDAVSITTKRVSLPGYEILGKLGEGGMGVIYKARHLRLNRTVAIKMILAGEHANEVMRTRFTLEAETVAQLQHPGIVQIYEISEHEGHSFLALEYVAGGSLASRLDDKPWPADKAAELVENLAHAMQVAHDHGIIHRDLKPDNVLLVEASDGKLTPKITDFGLAKRLQDAAGRTRTGEVMGTPSYMAPEQAAGKKDLGPPADIYALGAILYRLLTGRPPFHADTSLNTLMLVLEQEPLPLRALNKSLPRELEAIVLKCLAKDASERYARAADLAADLRAFRLGEAVSVKPSGLLKQLHQGLHRRHRDILSEGWPRLLLAVGLTILIGCALANFWELWLTERHRWWVMLLTKLVQVGVMLFLAVRLRPFTERGMTAVERQVWNLVPAYYGAFLSLLIVNYFLAEPVPLAPVLAVLSGMGFATLGASIWGWFYAWAAAFFALAVLMVCLPFGLTYGLTLLGCGWFVALLVGGIQLHFTRKTE